jgi:hypothetical protein
MDCFRSAGQVRSMSGQLEQLLEEKSLLQSDELLIDGLLIDGLFSVLPGQVRSMSGQLERLLEEKSLMQSDLSVKMDC